MGRMPEAYVWRDCFIAQQSSNPEILSGSAFDSSDAATCVVEKTVELWKEVRTFGDSLLDC